MRALVVALSLAAAGCVSAQGANDTQAPFATVQPPAVATSTNYPVAVDLPSGAYRLDPRHASVLFRIRHEGLAWFTARFDTKDATLDLNAADPAQSRLTASIDANSVNTGILNAQGERGFDRSIAGAIGAQATPQISFASTAIERTGQYTARVTGDLTMNGQTHPATFDVTFDGGKTDVLRGGAVAIGFSGHASIDRTQWGVTQWGPFTGNEVQIVIEAEFTHS